MQSRSGESIYNSLMAIAKEQKNLPSESIEALTDEVQRRNRANKPEKFYLKLMKREVFIDRKDSTGMTILMHAASTGNLELIHALLTKCGASSDIQDNKNQDYQHILLAAMTEYVRNNQFKKITRCLAVIDSKHPFSFWRDITTNILYKKIIEDARRNYFDVALKEDLPNDFFQSCMDIVLSNLIDKNDSENLVKILTHYYRLELPAVCHTKFLSFVSQSKDERALVSLKQLKDTLPDEYFYNFIQHNISELYRIFTDVISQASRAGHWEQLKQLKDIIPTRYFYDYCDTNKMNLCRLVQTSLDQNNVAVVRFLIEEYGADVHSAGEKPNYARYINLYFIELAKKKLYSRMADILRACPEISLTYYDIDIQSVQAKLCDDFYDAVMKNDTAVIDGIKAISPNIKQFGFTLDRLEALLKYEITFLNKGESQAKTLLSYDVLTSQLPESKMKPLQLALFHKETKYAEYIITHGGICGRRAINSASKRLVEKYVKFDLGLNHLLSSLNYILSSLKKDLGKIAVDQSIEIKSLDKRCVSDVKNIIDAIQKCAVDFASLHPYEKIDLIILARNLLPVLKGGVTQYALETQLKSALAKREDAIAGSFMDYCYSPGSKINKLCAALAKYIHENIPTNNRLLYQACHKDRKDPWFDPAVGTDAEELPVDSSQFFRLPNNEIHLYEYVVESAIARLKQGFKLLPHVWFGTDPKNTTPVPPLNEDSLYVLKQRSPTLKKLVEFTEFFDKYTRKSMQTNVYDQLTVLRDGLYAGDVRVSGEELQAGEAAYATVASFADWWNQLQQKQPKMCDRIKQLGRSYPGSRETLGQAIDIVLDVEHKTEEERDDSVYCVHGKADILYRVLGSVEVVAELKAMQSQIVNHHQEAISQALQKLDEWLVDIKKELATAPERILTHHLGKFPTMATWERDLSLLGNSGIKEYDALGWHVGSKPSEKKSTSADEKKSILAKKAEIKPQSGSNAHMLAPPLASLRSRGWMAFGFSAIPIDESDTPVDLSLDNTQLVDRCCIM